MTRAANILVVEDDAAMRESCTKLFRMAGYGASEASSAVEALEQIRQRDDIDVVLTDLKMPGMDGLSLLKEIKLLAPSVEVVLMTGYGTIKTAVEAMKHGAVDYITKPFDTDELLTTIAKVIEFGQMREEVLRLRLELRDKYQFDSIVGVSPPMQLVYQKIEATKNTASTVLICGESGTGKELVAKAIHYNGRRANNPFVAVNCAAIPRDIFESELFGHMKGAFTGATSDSTGLFRAAHGGTIFLDEILDMPYATQAKLLRALQEKQIRPVGGTEEIPIDVRVITSSNQDVAEAIRKNTFREDLYYRIGVIRIDLPPLRARSGDVPALVQHFIAKFNGTFRRTVKGLTKDALKALTQYHWPGNVRELAGAIESAFSLGGSDTIERSDLPGGIAEKLNAAARELRDRNKPVPTILEAERKLLLRALDVTGGNKTRAAELLGVSRPRLYKMIQRHEVQDQPDP